MAKKRQKPMMLNGDPLEFVPNSFRQAKDNDLYLYRPVMGDNKPAGFERLACGNCGGAVFEVDRTGDGWCVECAACGDAASMLTDLINGTPE